MRPLVIAVAGGTASGKTTIANAFCAKVGALLVSHDRYYRDCPEPDGVNFDHPDSLETTLLVAHLDALLRGEAVDLPTYDFATHRRAVAVDRVRARPVIVVEGILALAAPELVARCELTVFVACPDDVRLLRRVVRDCGERGRSVTQVAVQYLATVRPMHQQFVAPCESRAMLVLDGMAPTDAEVARLVSAAGA